MRPCCSSPGFPPAQVLSNDWIGNLLLQEVLEGLGGGYQQHGARVEVIDLPDLDGDRVQIRQLFQNLIANAIKYRRRETAPEVRINGRLPEDGVCEITMADNGIGLGGDEVWSRSSNPLSACMVEMSARGAVWG